MGTEGEDEEREDGEQSSSKISSGPEEICKKQKSDNVTKAYTNFILFRNLNFIKKPPSQGLDSLSAKAKQGSEFNYKKAKSAFKRGRLANLKDVVYKSKS